MSETMSSTANNNSEDTAAPTLEEEQQIVVVEDKEEIHDENTTEAETEVSEDATDAAAAALALREILMGLSAGEQDEDTPANSNPMLQAVKTGLDTFDLRYEALSLPDSPHVQVITFGLRSRVCGQTNVVCTVEQQEDKFLYLTKLPTLVPEEHRGNVALYLTRVNYGMSIGNFEMDLDDGEVRYKCSCKTVDSALSVEMVKFTVALSVQMVDKFFPGLMAVVYGGKDPKEAHDDCMGSRGGETEENVAQ